jgi:hypothetical protein
MCSLAELERRVLCPPDHDDTELSTCEECNNTLDEDNFCDYCYEERENAIATQHLAEVA